MSQDHNIAFCRIMLRMTMDDVREHTTAKERKDAWVISVGRQHWEFHGPDGYYWHGSADNAYDARSSGWSAWLRSKGYEEDDNKKESQDGQEA